MNVTSSNGWALLSTYKGCINILFPQLLQSQHDSAAWVESCLSRRYQGVVGHVNITEIKKEEHSEAMFYFKLSPNCIVDQLNVPPVAIEVERLVNVGEVLEAGVHCDHLPAHVSHGHGVHPNVGAKVCK